MTPEEQAAADAAAAAAAKGDDIAAQIKAAVDKEVGGLKAKNDELLGINKKLRDSVTAFDGLDPAKVKELMKHFDSSEEAQLLAQGKIDEVLNKRYEKKDAETQRILAEANAAVEAAKQNGTKFYDRLFRGEIRASAPADHHQAAMEDAMRHAAEVFELNDRGDAVPKDGRFGRDGKTPYSLKEFFEDTRGTHPHRFVNGNSGSSNFNNNGSGTAKTMARSKFDSLQPHEKANTIKAGITIVDR